MVTVDRSTLLRRGFCENPMSLSSYWLKGHYATQCNARRRRTVYGFALVHGVVRRSHGQWPAYVSTYKSFIVQCQCLVARILTWGAKAVSPALFRSWPLSLQRDPWASYLSGYELREALVTNPGPTPTGAWPTTFLRIARYVQTGTESKPKEIKGESG